MTLTDRLRSALEKGMARETEIFSRDLPQEATLLSPVDAAVLVAVTDRAEPGVILTRRPMTMRNHPGQIAFPGGRKDDGDEDIIAAALREAEEEIGLPPSTATIIGLTDQYRTITSYVITPVLAVVPSDIALTPHEAEVEAVFEVPLAFLMNPANHKTATIDWEGATREYFEMHWQEHHIWGATAAMIVNLSRRLQWSA
jgi:8-oxo-dGTP pyrophosphatase MutT (NUDIX family)